MKKVLLTALSAALLASCASKRAAVVDSAITEARTLQALAKAQGTEVPASIDELIAKAEKQNDERQTEDAYIMADEAVLRLQISLLEKERAAAAAETKNAAESLEQSQRQLDAYRNVLKERKNMPKEQVIHK